MTAAGRKSQRRGSTLRYWLGLVLAVSSTLMLMATLIHPAWLELVFGVDPDGGSGSLEWMLTVVLALGAVLGGGVFTFERRRLRTAT